ncbi:MAG: hypothetical protein L3J95_02100 [Thermoplasmata archaeon]|nr:hypothetical protein [Thermoplasmata archaeon]MCI4359204.1 hypothetical protein [Thermoplasmata archaeon]
MQGREEDGAKSRNVERTRGTVGKVALGLAIGLTVLVSILAVSGQGLTATSGRAVPWSVASGVAHGGGHVLASPSLSTQTYTPLTLSIGAVPHSICVDNSPLCAAQQGESVVTMTAAAPNTGLATWPSVQVAFVIETAAYDGVYDPSAGDPGQDHCAIRGTTLCEESNGVPFFIAHSQQIANAIAAANPHSNVSFALVDYFASLDNHDDGDGQEYHVDIPQFVTSGSFGGQVQSSFQAGVLGGGYIYGDNDMSDNILHSSVITAMFGAIIGSGLDWSPATHHVIVWMGSTAPRDPNYIENYAVSTSDYQAGESATCEPSFSFGAVTEPNCEGWVRSQDGNGTHSIAGLAKSSPSCIDSIGGVCTVDAIDLYATPTDPTSTGWPCPGGPNGAMAKAGGCPNGAAVRSNVAHVLLAGCDIAAATGGTWDGPDFFSCPNGQYGHLQPSFVGANAFSPNLNNPSLFSAFRQVGFGPVIGTQVANGTGHPIFQYVPYGSIQLVPNQTFQPAQCLLPSGQPFRQCDRVPQLLNYSGHEALGWNWSTKASSNQMYLGDVWTASFLVYATGPPLATVPADSCVTAFCKAGGSRALNGQFTWATYIPSSNNTVVTQSFPLAQIDVEGLPGVPAPPTPPPPPPPVPPPFAIPAPTAVPVLTALGISAQVGVASISLQAAMAGFLGAGFIRMATRNKPIANPVLAGKQKKGGSVFDTQSSGRAGVGKFE